MKNIYQILIAIIILCNVTVTNAQGTGGNQHSFTIDASQVISTFSFANSVSSKNLELFGTSNYNPSVSGAYSFGYRGIYGPGILVRGSLGMRKAGASTVIDEVNHQWDLQYFEVKIGGGYLYSFSEKLGVYATLSPYYAYLLKANQRLDNEDFDIKKSGDLNTSDFGLQFAPGVVFNVSDFVSVYGEVGYGLGLINLETGETEQNSYNVAYAFTLGLAFSIQ